MLLQKGFHPIVQKIMLTHLLHPFWCIHLFLWVFLTSFCVYVWLKVTIIQKVFSFLLPYLLHFSLTKYWNCFSPFKLLSKKLSVPWLSPDNSKAVEGLFTILLNGMLVHDFFPQIGWFSSICHLHSLVIAKSNFQKSADQFH